MNQSKIESLIEVGMNIGSGLFLSALIIQPLLFPYYGIVTNTTQNIAMASIFTIVSVVRGYIWRRLFNDGSLHKKIHYVVSKIIKRRKVFD